MKPTLLVLAAGMGSRFGGLKQIEPVGPQGEWILDFSVYDAIESGFDKVVFVIREEMESAFSVVRDRYAGRIEVAFAFQRADDLPCLPELAKTRQKPWGTGHAVYAARNVLPGPFAVINADDFYGKAAFEALGAFLSNEALGENEYALVGYRLENTLSDNGSVSRGICHSSDGIYLNSVEEHTDIERKTRSGDISAIDDSGAQTMLAADAKVSLNCWGFPAAFSKSLEASLSRFLENCDAERQSEFYLPFAVDALIQSGEAKAKILDCSSRWLGVTHREDMPFVMSEIDALFFARGEYTAPLW